MKRRGVAVIDQLKTEETVQGESKDPNSERLDAGYRRIYRANKSMTSMNGDLVGYVGAWVGWLPVVVL